VCQGKAEKHLTAALICHRTQLFRKTKECDRWSGLGRGNLLIILAKIFGVNALFVATGFLVNLLQELNFTLFP